MPASSRYETCAGDHAASTVDARAFEANGLTHIRATVEGLDTRAARWDAGGSFAAPAAHGRIAGAEHSAGGQYVERWIARPTSRARRTVRRDVSDAKRIATGALRIVQGGG